MNVWIWEILDVLDEINLWRKLITQIFGLYVKSLQIGLGQRKSIKLVRIERSIRKHI